jgi:hypothetical protein
MKTLNTPIPPGGTIGIIGGGQLGRMLAMAAARLGMKTCIYNDAPDAPAFQVTDRSFAAPYDDLEKLAAFADACDAVTFEFENLPAHAIAHLADRVPVRPGAHALAITQDRLSEKTFVERLGLKTAPFFDVTSAGQAREAFAPEAVLHRRAADGPVAMPAIGCRTLAEVSAHTARLEAAGLKVGVPGRMHEWGFQAAYLSDPSHNLWEIYATERTDV